ncbi:MAG: DUF3098 domain-containing protein [Paramuribaculum sp.]|nr:DUF3098 domain-containing protein [Paramuribaculum sp.]
MAKITIKKSQSQENNGLERESKQDLPLTRINFILMGVAGAIIVLGFLLMTGAPATSEAFNPDIFSTRRIVVGPTIAFLGFLFMGFAIMWKSNDRKNSAGSSSEE